ncbi:hypothetical protein Tsubulata_015933, partial [Turnera subulata]
MAAEEEHNASSSSSTLPPETTTPASADAQSLMDATPTVQLIPPLIPPIMPPPLVPPIAPIPTITAPSVPRPLAPLPIRPPVLRPPPPTSQNGGEMRTSDSDSDQDDAGPSGTTSAAAEYEISEGSWKARERKQKAVQEFMMKRRAAALAVPTNDISVRARLRRLDEPITLFGEREMERRDRLRTLMAKLDAEGQLEKLMKAHDEEEAAATTVPEVAEEESYDYPFLTEGSKALLDARISIAKFSISRAALRLQSAKRKRDDPDEDMDAEIDYALEQAGNALSGVAKIWRMPQKGDAEEDRQQLSRVATLKGHAERATDIAFSPQHNHLATGSADRTARLWNTDGSLVRTFEGHLDRLGRIAFHPSGNYLGTTSFDKTWRLWDVETGVELLLQEGHSRSIYGLAFHPDGSLAASCGLDSLARVWDLRIGKSILSLEGHVLGVSFSPNGYHLATGGEDNTCRIWDLRKKKSLYIIPAHANLISQVKFDPQEGYYLVTASYDMTAKVWSGRDFKPIRTLSAHEAKVTSLDVVAALTSSVSMIMMMNRTIFPFISIHVVSVMILFLGRGLAREASLLGSAIGQLETKTGFRVGADGGFKAALFADLHFGEASSTEWGPKQDMLSRPTTFLYKMRACTGTWLSLQQEPGAFPGLVFSETMMMQPLSGRWNGFLPLVSHQSIALPITPHVQGTPRIELMKREIQQNILSLSEAGPKGLWPSVSNYVLQLSSSKDPQSPVAFMYFLDSGGGSYPEVISSTQAEWFEHKSEEINPHASVPEIIFWHIPSRAYKKVAPKFGIRKPCVGSINKEKVAAQEAELGIMTLINKRPSVKITEKPFSIKSWIRMEDGVIHSEVILT